MNASELGIPEASDRGLPDNFMKYMRCHNCRHFKNAKIRESVTHKAAKPFKTLQSVSSTQELHDHVREGKLIKVKGLLLVGECKEMNDPRFHDLCRNENGMIESVPADYICANYEVNIAEA